MRAALLGQTRKRLSAHIAVHIAEDMTHMRVSLIFSHGCRVSLHVLTLLFVEATTHELALTPLGY